jgi:hypothetical protein
LHGEGIVFAGQTEGQVAKEIAAVYEDVVSPKKKPERAIGAATRAA